MSWFRVTYIFGCMSARKVKIFIFSYPLVCWLPKYSMTYWHAKMSCLLNYTNSSASWRVCRSFNLICVWNKLLWLISTLENHKLLGNYGNTCCLVHQHTMFGCNLDNVHNLRFDGNIKYSTGIMITRISEMKHF